MTTEYKRIFIRRDTESNFSTAGTIPHEGEFCYSTDKEELKLGDGSNNFMQLEHFTKQSEVRASKSYLDEGELLSDTQGLNDVTSYAHSTFDLSKFTVVSSPNITDDGIASGFAGNGFIRTADTINFSSTFELYAKINTGTIISSNKNIIATNSVQGIIIITGNGKLRIQLGDGTQWVSEVLTASGTVNSNTDYLIKFTYDGTEYALYVLENGTWTKQISYPSVTQFLPSGYAINIGGNRGGTGEFEGSVDLKYFALKVDRVPVFSGNQTGVDTYTINGSTVTIPYNLSKTGSKIVDSTYRGRVASVYEYLGYAPYYTLSDTDFTLPMGEIYGITNKEIEDIKETVEEKSLVAGYLNEGYEITNKKEIELVNKYAHSTFDLSKFTVVGSPTITDDGIASGFSSNTNYIRPYFLNSLPSKLITKARVKTPDTLTNIAMTALAIKDTIDSNILCYVRKDTNATRFICGFRKSDGTYNNKTVDITANTFYNIEVIKEGSNIQIIINNQIIQNEVDLNTSSNIEYICVGSQNGYNAWLDSIDLKQFSITVDGVPVFSGNQTGIDTIKSDDYTVVGTPTISADSVASGFSGTKYVKTASLSISNATDFECFSPYFKLGEIASGNNIVMNFTTNTKLILFYRQSNSKLESQLWHDSTPLTSMSASTDISLNKWYQFRWVYKNSAWSSYLRELGGDWTTIKSNISDATGVTISGEKPLGWENSNSYLQNGFLDLNAFKIYVDGNLAYQPCLKIPYTLSKTGSKIVDSAYRDRANDMYEQFGYANYFVKNDNYVIKPYGEIYGLIENTTKSQLVPDYASLTHVSLTSAYTVPYACLCYVYLDTGRNGSFTINNKTITKANTLMTFELNKGDVISATCNSGYYVIVDLIKYKKSTETTTSTIGEFTAGIYQDTPEP